MSNNNVILCLIKFSEVKQVQLEFTYLLWIWSMYPAVDIESTAFDNSLA